jgi:RNA polymerase sigma-70 factor (ECF subfamily)
VLIPNDTDLLAKIAKGDERAFVAIYDRHASHVYALALRILHDPMLAEEATQDAFLKLWSRARQFVAERGSLLVWLLTITRRTALDRLRLESRRPSLSDSTDPEELLNTIPEVSTFSEESRWHSMAMVVQTLPPDQRQVLEMAYYQGLSQSEIAEMLGWPLGTVKTRLRTAMELLRRAWGEL